MKGLFRLSGSSSKLRKLTSALDAGVIYMPDEKPSTPVTPVTPPAQSDLARVTCTQDRRTRDGQEAEGAGPPSFHCVCLERICPSCLPEYASTHTCVHPVKRRSSAGPGDVPLIGRGAKVTQEGPKGSQESPADLAPNSPLDAGILPTTAQRPTGGMHSVASTSTSTEVRCVHCVAFRQLRRQLSAPEVDEWVPDVHVLAGAIKQYLRQLPDPLLTHALYDKWALASLLYASTIRNIH